MPSFESIAWEDYMELLLSGCALIAAFAIGCLLNHIVHQKLLQHVDTSEINLQSIFIRALRGIPILFCLATALYWIVDSVSFPASIAKIFSCIFFTVIVFTIVRVLERTLSGLVNWKLSGTDNAMAQSTLLDTIFTVVVPAFPLVGHLPVEPPPVVRLVLEEDVLEQVGVVPEHDPLELPDQAVF